MLRLFGRLQLLFRGFGDSRSDLGDHLDLLFLLCVFSLGVLVFHGEFFCLCEFLLRLGFFEFLGIFLLFLI